MIQGEAQMTKTLIDKTRRGLEANMAGVEVRTEGGRERGTGAGKKKPPKFDGPFSSASSRP
jgi:hypothetical protein